MALTVLQCADFVKLTLAGAADTSLSTLTLVNMAGQSLCGMSEWRWLQRAPVDVGVVAAQEYATLPIDFGAMLAMVPSTGFYGIVWTDLGEIAGLRAASAQTSANGPWRGVVIDSIPSGSTLPRAQVELYPTPSATSTTAFKLAYRAKWTNLTSDSDYIPIPEWCETLFIRLLQVHARGFMEEDKASLSMRLAEIKSSAELIGAVKQDRARQRDRGALKGSLSSPNTYDYRSRFTTITGP